MTKIYVPKPKSEMAIRKQKEREIKARVKAQGRRRSARADTVRWMLLAYINKTSAIDLMLFLEEWLRTFEGTKKRIR